MLWSFSVLFIKSCLSVCFFVQEMSTDEKAKITDLKKCNFTEMSEYFKAQSEARKAMSKEEKLVSSLVNTL